MQQQPDPTPEEFAQRLAEIQATDAFQKRQPKPEIWLPPVIELAAVRQSEELDK